MACRQHPLTDPTRRAWLLALSAGAMSAFADSGTPLARAMRRAEALRDEALRAGDQPYGAVVLRGDTIVGEGPAGS